MKRTTFEDAAATYDDKLAMIMAVGDATIEEASRALEECNGEVNGALTLVYDRAPPSNAIVASSSLNNTRCKSLRKVPYMEGVDNESIVKPSAAAVAPNALQGNVFNEPLCQPSTISPKSPANPSATNAITPRVPLLHAPGAFAIGGRNDGVGGHEDDTFTYTQQNISVVGNNINTPTNPTGPVEARLVDHSEDDYVENLEERLQQREQQLENLQRRQENIVVGKVLGVNTNDCCKPFPYGCLMVVPIVFGLLGTILTWAALANCYFLMATTNFSVAGIGYIKYVDPYLYTCQVWDAEDQDALFDGSWRFGKTMGWLASILGLVFLIMSFMPCCMVVPRLTMKLVAAGYLLLGVFSILMLVGLASDVCSTACQWIPLCTQCSLSMGPGARMCIVAFLLFAGASVATFYLKEREAVVAVDADAKDKEKRAVLESALPQSSIGTTIDVVEVLNGDGTKTVTTTTTNPDGTKVTHKSIERAFTEEDLVSE
jgi:hypothetical protein